MAKLISKIGVVLFFLFCFPVFNFAQESITITTYYPSPYGVYNKLRLYPNDQDCGPQGTSCSNAGEMCFRQSDNTLYVCNGTSWVTTPGGQWGAFWAASPTNPNNIYNTNPGNVGIEMDNPQAKLDIRGNLFTRNSGVGFLELAVREGTDIGVITVKDGSALLFRHASRDDMYIDAAGNVGIGTTNPGARLEVGSGEVRMPGGTNPNNWQTHFNYSGDGKNYIRGTTIMADNGGNVGIGTNRPEVTLDVNGPVILRGIPGVGVPGRVLMSLDTRGYAIWGNPPRLRCRITPVRSNRAWNNVWVHSYSCNADEVETGGGGWCDNGSLWASHPLGDGRWKVACGVRSDWVTANVQNMCCKIE